MAQVEGGNTYVYVGPFCASAIACCAGTVEITSAQESEQGCRVSALHGCRKGPGRSALTCTGKTMTMSVIPEHLPCATHSSGHFTRTDALNACNGPNYEGILSEGHFADLGTEAGRLACSASPGAVSAAFSTARAPEAPLLPRGPDPVSDWGDGAWVPLQVGIS